MRGAATGVMAGEHIVRDKRAPGLKIVSTTVIGTVIQVRTGAGLSRAHDSAWRRNNCSGRKDPSLIGKSNGVVKI